PKSLDRNAFRHWVTEEGRLNGKSTPDGAATLTAITAAAVAHAITVLPRPPAGWIVAGGGTRHPTLMRMFAERLAPAPVARPRAGRARGRGRLARRRARGAGLRLSRRANAQGLAAHLSHHDGRTAPAHGRHPGAAVGGSSR